MPIEIDPEFSILTKREIEIITLANLIERREQLRKEIDLAKIIKHDLEKNIKSDIDKKC